MKKTLLLTAVLVLGITTYAIDNEQPADNTEIAVTETSVNANEVEYVYERRFCAITEAGTVFANDKAFFSIYQAIGIRINPYVFIGQGAGIQVTENKQFQMQATVDLRAYALDKKVTPVFLVQAGLNKVGNVPENEKIKLNDTQFIMNAGTGILIKARENASFTINGGYTIFTDFKNNMHGGFVKVGYVF